MLSSHVIHFRLVLLFYSLVALQNITVHNFFTTRTDDLRRKSIKRCIGGQRYAAYSSGLLALALVFLDLHFPYLLLKEYSLEGWCKEPLLVTFCDCIYKRKVGADGMVWPGGRRLTLVRYADGRDLNLA
jgi:hypothetical protein